MDSEPPYVVHTLRCQGFSADGRKVMHACSSGLVLHVPKHLQIMHSRQKARGMDGGACKHAADVWSSKCPGTSFALMLCWTVPMVLASNKWTRCSRYFCCSFL